MGGRGDVARLQEAVALATRDVDGRRKDLGDVDRARRMVNDVLRVSLTGGQNP